MVWLRSASYTEPAGGIAGSPVALRQPGSHSLRLGVKSGRFDVEGRLRHARAGRILHPCPSPHGCVHLASLVSVCSPLAHSTPGRRGRPGAWQPASSHHPPWMWPSGRMRVSFERAAPPATRVCCDAWRSICSDRTPPSRPERPSGTVRPDAILPAWGPGRVLAQSCDCLGGHRGQFHFRCYGPSPTVGCLVPCVPPCLLPTVLDDIRHDIPIACGLGPKSTKNLRNQNSARHGHQIRQWLSGDNIGGRRLAISVVVSTQAGLVRRTV